MKMSNKAIVSSVAILAIFGIVTITGAVSVLWSLLLVILLIEGIDD